MPIKEFTASSIQVGYNKKSILPILFLQKNDQNKKILRNYRASCLNGKLFNFYENKTTPVKHVLFLFLTEICHSIVVTQNKPFAL